MKHYAAPWSTGVIIVSAAITLICLSLTFVLVYFGRGFLPWLGLLPLAIIVGAAPFAIRGYTLTSDAILVHRLLWTTRLPLAGLKSAQFQPDVMRRSIRSFGNGGLFSITGFFYNKALGRYRAFVTDQHRTVVLNYSRRTVVISPARPDEFVQDLPIPSHEP